MHNGQKGNLGQQQPPINLLKLGKGGGTQLIPFKRRCMPMSSNVVRQCANPTQYHWPFRCHQQICDDGEETDAQFSRKGQRHRIDLVTTGKVTETLGWPTYVTICNT
jgi:hypothetical protein